MAADCELSSKLGSAACHVAAATAAAGAAEAAEAAHHPPRPTS